jgi:hypothetical protein
VAKRISGASQFVEWFDKYGETGLEFSAATEELITSIKEVQPYQRQFVDDWVKLGPHVDAEEAWEKELSSIPNCGFKPSMRSSKVMSYRTSINTTTA